LTTLPLLFALAASAALAKLPVAFLADLPTADVQQVSTRVDQLPHPIRRALATTFHQKALFIADAGRPFQETDVVLTKPGDKPLPFRRLQFAFPTSKYFVVYYESGGYGRSVAALVFSRPVLGTSKFIWGGVELADPAKTLSELIRRIQHRKFMDHLPFIW
jgi:hypothetical protein